MEKYRKNLPSTIDISKIKKMYCLDVGSTAESVALRLSLPVPIVQKMIEEHDLDLEKQKYISALQTNTDQQLIASMEKKITITKLQTATKAASILDDMIERFGEAVNNGETKITSKSIEQLANVVKGLSENNSTVKNTLNLINNGNVDKKVKDSISNLPTSVLVNALYSNKENEVETESVSDASYEVIDD